MEREIEQDLGKDLICGSEALDKGPAFSFYDKWGLKQVTSTLWI